ncbi:MAG TPA: hypothetical protein VMM13_09685, partial [Euzebya sp.]|nr:hypothetical protein [Euzebya sp.]
MTDSTDIREQVAAFLAGDLDDVAAEELQGRIDTEPWVARLADEMADMLMALGRVDDVPLPQGFTERLFEGMESELGRSLAPPLPDQRTLHASGAAAATGWPEGTRPRRRQGARRPSAGTGGPDRRSRLRGALAVAAVVVVLAVAGVGVLTQVGDFGSTDDGADTADAGFAADEDVEIRVADEDSARTTADDAPAEAAVATADEAAEADAGAEGAAADAGQQESEAAEDAVASGEAEAPSVALSVPTTSDGPMVMTLGEVDGDDGTLAAVVGDQPAAQDLLGTDAADVAELAAAYRDELLRGPDFDDGTSAGACLIDTLDAAGQDLVPAVAARLDLPDGPVVAYALVRSRDGTVLDAVDVWVLDLPGCGIDRVIR